MVNQPKAPAVVQPKAPTVVVPEAPPPPPPVSEQFPRAKLIRLQVEFHDSTGARIQRRCRDLAPDSPGVFDMKCPLDAVPIDFKPIIARMIRSREKKRTGQNRCTASQADSEHNATYIIAIEYKSTKSR